MVVLVLVFALVWLFVLLMVDVSFVFDLCCYSVCMFVRFGACWWVDFFALIVLVAWFRL